MTSTRTPKQIAADKVDDGGAAFPTDASISRGPNDGMSLRDWLAGQALAGLYASRDLQLAVLHDSRADEFEIVMARQAYAQADAMLRVRVHMHPRDRGETNNG
jgi:hypothetical protein